MLQPDAWKSFFNNIDNKKNLINLLVAYLRSDSFSNQIRIPVIVSDDKNTWKITTEFPEIIFKSNHEEADTRIILHALQEDTKVAVVSKDRFFNLVSIFVCKVQTNERKVHEN